MSVPMSRHSAETSTSLQNTVQFNPVVRSSDKSLPTDQVRSGNSVEIGQPTYQPYVPSPYSFRTSSPNVNLKKTTARCPPFYLQLDHTLAVVWTLFSDNPPITLGIVQLQWALNFLRGVCSRRGEYPKDVALCIQAIEELLLQRYAEMVDDVTVLEEDEIKKEIRRLDAYSGKNKTRICESQKCLGRQSAIPDNNLLDDDDMISLTFPFSVNYTDIADKAGANIQQLFTKEQFNKAPSDMSGLDGDGLPENEKQFLKQWRKDQINKIQADLDRLHSLETFMGCGVTVFDSKTET